MVLYLKSFASKRWQLLFWESLFQEELISRVVGLFHPGIAQVFEETVELLAVLGRHLHAHQNAAVVGTLVAVVEQRDVPGGRHQAEELEQRTGALGEDKAQQALVLGQR